MRLYGKKFAKNMVDKRVRSFIENRDCIIWEVLKDEKICRVRMQGSNTDIYAKFPQNVKTVPSWMRVGNSVQISHRSGVRGHVYVTGQGTSIPTVVAGEPLPDPGIAPNGVISGMIITSTDPESMAVNISTGTYRINDVEYSFSVTNVPMYYDDPPVIMYDSTPVIVYDELRYTLSDAPSVTYFRYDAFCVGADGVLDYLQGAVSKTPVKPDIPTGHILIDRYILVIGGHSVITAADIGGKWTATQVSYITIDIEGEGISYDMPYDNSGTWGVPEDDPQYTYADIVVTVYDQYNNALPGNYTLKIDKVYGNGDFWSDDSGYGDNGQEYIGGGSAYTFKYRREQAVDSGTVIFNANVTVSGTKYELIGIIELLAGA